MDIRGFVPQLAGVEDMADYILESRGAQQFVQRRPELKTRFTRVYDFQRALCEDPGLISAWFRLVENMRSKYGVPDSDFYNFDETGFMMGQICPGMVVTRTDRRGRGKGIRPGNREWATAIACINGEGWSIPLITISCHFRDLRPDPTPPTLMRSASIPINSHLFVLLTLCWTL